MTVRIGNIDERQAVALPSFGELLRRLRDDRAVSRERLAFAAGVSASYITQLEKGGKAKPTRAVVDALVRCLELWNPLSATELRYLHDLAGLEIGGHPTVAELRKSIDADALRVLAMHRPNLAALYDTRGNVLAGNEDWAQAFPGLREGGNLYRWMFADPVAREVMADWESDVRQSVGWLRGTVGSAADPGGFAGIMRELGAFPDFRRFWAEGDVGFAPPVRTMRLRDRSTGALRNFRVQAGLLNTALYPGHIVAMVAIPV
ncbi:helix-turn-helix transcriptional regulator [Nocardia sp. NPDC046763]|uniref:helix-turn-helix domain-containing protein n=1 Tax=Nocardia sp. NPDC046763 TaxID=3155256 RepID=UPI0033C2C093